MVLEWSFQVLEDIFRDLPTSFERENRKIFYMRQETCLLSAVTAVMVCPTTDSKTEYASSGGRSMDVLVLRGTFTDCQPPNDAIGGLPHGAESVASLQRT
jgi:hypothetical protein